MTIGRIPPFASQPFPTNDNRPLNNQVASARVNVALKDNGAADPKNNRICPITSRAIINSRILRRRPDSLPQAASPIIIIHIINQGIYRNNISGLDGRCTRKGYDESQDENYK
jgi:hypothetical protein